LKTLMHPEAVGRVARLDPKFEFRTFCGRFASGPAGIFSPVGQS
jgi:hypothetical protein